MAHVILEMKEYTKLKINERKIEDLKEKILNLLDDKINEAENETNEEYSEEFLKGYILGIKHAKICIEEEL